MSEHTSPAVVGRLETPVKQHTPGPWEWGGDINDDEYVVKVGSLRMVEFRYSGATTAEAVANARLAAAAPELLELVEQLAACHDESSCPAVTLARDLVRRIRAA